MECRGKGEESCQAPATENTHSWLSQQSDYNVHSPEKYEFNPSLISRVKHSLQVQGMLTQIIVLL